MNQIILLLFVCFFSLPQIIQADDFNRVQALRDAQTWMYQIQDLYNDGAIEALAATEYPMLVLEPTYTIQGEESFDTAHMLDQLRITPQGKTRLLIAYIDIGQAESYRYYWKKNWRAPQNGRRGKPSFIVGLDPDGWSENYPVAYWRKRWKKIWLGKKRKMKRKRRGGQIEKLARLGFDGIYLDWVEAYDDENVIAYARQRKVNTARKMISFIRDMKRAGRRVTSDFLVIAQNAPYLIDEAPRKYTNIIDALAMEDTWFQGDGDASWEDLNGGDIANPYSEDYSTTNLITQYKRYSEDFNIPVFTIDYCLKEENAEQVYRDSRSHSFRPLVSRVALSKLTKTPPPEEK